MPKNLDNILEGIDGNDVQITFSQRNGIGLNTVTHMLGRILFHSGYFASTHAIFPSNIKDENESYLNWFDIRGNKSGFKGIKEKSQIVVAMYKTPLDYLVEKVQEGGIFVYDSHLIPKLSDHNLRVLEEKNATIYSLNLKELADIHGTQGKGPTKSHNFARHSILLGFVLGAIGIDETYQETIAKALQENFEKEGKTENSAKKLTEQNLEWINKGWQIYKAQEIQTGWHIGVGKSLEDDYLFTTGNDMLAAGAFQGGARVYLGYPITPATSVGDAMYSMFVKLFGKKSGKFLFHQAGAELEAGQMAVGAARGGARVLTASSMPGINNQWESIAMAAMAQTPGVLWTNIQRAGPSTGLPTRSSDEDLLTMIYGGGEFPRIILSPGDIDSLATMPVKGFNLSDNSHLQVMLLGNLWSGMNYFTVPKISKTKFDPIDRGDFKVPEEIAAQKTPIAFARYVIDRVAQVRAPGSAGAPMQRSALAKMVEDVLQVGGAGVYTEAPESLAMLKEQLFKRIDMVEDYLPKPVLYDSNGTRKIYSPGENLKGDYGLIVWSSSVEPAREAQAILRHKYGIDVEILHLQTVHPIVESHGDAIRQFVDNYQTGKKRVFVVEQNFEGQLRKILMSESVLAKEGKIIPNLGLVNKYDGIQMTADYIIRNMGIGA